MQAQRVTPSAAIATATTLAGATKRTDSKPGQQVDYMKLIVAQMRNLNPMDPSSGGDSLPTMMQAESLNQLTKLNQAIADLTTMTQTGYASSLIGKTVSGVDAGGNTITGTVKGLHMDAGGPALDLAGGKRLRLLDVSQVDGA